MSIRYLGQAEIGRELDVTRHTITVWRGRYGNFPEPDAWIGGIPGWLPERLPGIRAWEASRPGQGAGGGRPRKGGNVRQG